MDLTWIWLSFRDPFWHKPSFALKYNKMQPTNIQKSIQKQCGMLMHNYAPPTPLCTHFCKVFVWVMFYEDKTYSINGNPLQDGVSEALRRRWRQQPSYCQPCWFLGLQVELSPGVGDREMDALHLFAHPTPYWQRVMLGSLQPPESTMTNS